MMRGGIQLKSVWINVMMMGAFILAACGNTSDKSLSDASETNIVYENDDIISHNLEGVTVSFDYQIQKVTNSEMLSQSTNLQSGDYLLEISGEIQNEFEQIIYYTPHFDIETSEKVKIEQLSSTVVDEQILVNPQMETTFTVVYLIPKEQYNENEFLNLYAPAAFKEANSESSGDALGDSANWQIPIK
mgnify:CR=1 FL=1